MAKLFLQTELGSIFQTGVRTLSTHPLLSQLLLMCLWLIHHAAHGEESSIGSNLLCSTVQKLTKEKYGSDFRFQDPVAKVQGIDTFQNSLAALRTLFKVDLLIHSTAITGDTQITTR